MLSRAAALSLLVLTCAAPAGAAPFGPPQLLDDDALGVELAVAEDGTAALAWTSDTTDFSPLVRSAAVRDAGGRLGPVVRDLTSPAAANGVAAFMTVADGRGAVVWGTSAGMDPPLPATPEGTAGNVVLLQDGTALVSWVDADGRTLRGRWCVRVLRVCGAPFRIAQGPEPGPPPTAVDPNRRSLSFQVAAAGDRVYVVRADPDRSLWLTHTRPGALPIDEVRLDAGAPPMVDFEPKLETASDGRAAVTWGSGQSIVADATQVVPVRRDGSVEERVSLNRLVAGRALLGPGGLGVVVGEGRCASPCPTVVDLRSGRRLVLGGFPEGGAAVGWAVTAIDSAGRLVWAPQPDAMRAWVGSPDGSRWRTQRLPRIAGSRTSGGVLELDGRGGGLLLAAYSNGLGDQGKLALTAYRSEPVQPTRQRVRILALKRRALRIDLALPGRMRLVARGGGRTLRRSFELRAGISDLRLPRRMAKRRTLIARAGTHADRIRRR